MKTNPVSGSMTRRRFIGRVAGTAAALGLAPHVRGAAGSPEKLGVALVGLGAYATGQLAPALKLTQNCRLAGVVTGSREKGERWSRERGFPAKNIYGYDTMSRLADNPDIDVVYVVTPNALHAGHVIAAARAGKHVISEKPFTTNVPDALAAIAACREAKVKLSIGYRLHFDPYHAELRRHAREQDFGPLLKARGGFSFVMQQKVWRAEKKLAGGGPIMDLGIYFIQGACMAANGTAPVAVTAKEAPKTRPDMFVDVEEAMNFTLEFANGLVAQGTTSYRGQLNQMRAEGANGWIDIEPAFSYSGLHAETSAGPLQFEPAVNQQARQMDDFARCIREDRISKVSGEMGLRDMRIIEAIYASAAQGGRRTLVKV